MSHALVPQLGLWILLLGASTRFHETVAVVVKEVENGWIRVQAVDSGGISVASQSDQEDMAGYAQGCSFAVCC